MTSHTQKTIALGTGNTALDQIRQRLKQRIDNMPEDELKLLSYRLRIAEINKSIDNLEQEIKEVVAKKEWRKTNENGQRN